MDCAFYGLSLPTHLRQMFSLGASPGLKLFVWEYEENLVLQEKPLLAAVRIDQYRSIHSSVQQHHTLLCSH